VEEPGGEIKKMYIYMLMERRYGTEKAVGKAIGRAIRDCCVPREELFITTKLWNHKHHPNDVAQALEDSLNDLGLEYVDLFLMHYPVAWKQGDDLFPKENGKPAVVDIDYVDVGIFNAMNRFRILPPYSQSSC
jgi:alcohol dehydrogenase (NADP+)